MRPIHLVLLCYVNTDLHPLSYALVYVSERAHVSDEKRF